MFDAQYRRMGNRQASPRNSVPGNTRRVDSSGSKEALGPDDAGMRVGLDEGEDERVLEGTGRENIWDRIQLSSGKKPRFPGLTSPMQGGDTLSAPSSPFASLISSSEAHTPQKMELSADAEDERALPSPSSDSQEGPATSPSVMSSDTPSPSVVLAEALMSQAQLKEYQQQNISPEPTLSGVLRRRAANKKPQGGSRLNIYSDEIVLVDPKNLFLIF